jgi:hypothetical protein
MSEADIYMVLVVHLLRTLTGDKMMNHATVVKKYFSLDTGLQFKNCGS